MNGDDEQLIRPHRSCFLCSSQENYCFNSEADVFGLIEINQKKKGVKQWLSSLLWLDRRQSNFTRNSVIFICEVHYAKEDLVRVEKEDGTYTLKLVSDQVIPCHVKLEERALNNRINSFLFLLEDYEKCLNLGRIWVSEVANGRLMLMMDTKPVEIGIEENLKVRIWVEEKEEELKWAIDAGFIEANGRILFWSRLRGLMRYFEEMNFPTKTVLPMILPKKKETFENKEELKITLLSPETIKDERKTTKTGQKLKNFNSYSLKLLGLNPFNILKTATKLPTEVKINPNASTEVDSDIISNFLVVVDILYYHRPPNWYLVNSGECVCILKIAIAPLTQTPCIVKALKTDQNLQISAFINGKNVVNNMINKTPGCLSKKELLTYLQSIEKVPVKLPEVPFNPFEPEIKLEKLDQDEFLPGIIPSLNVLIDQLRAFDQNNWNPVCIDAKNVLLFKVDITGIPKFKRYVMINENLEFTIFNNDRIIPVHELLHPLHPLTLQKIHDILALLDETVFEEILRPSKYRPKTFPIYTVEDHRVVAGINGKRHKCSVCAYESNTLNYVKQHYEIKHTPPDRKCPECGKEMNATQLKIHARFHIKKVHCYICNKGFADSRDLKKHINVHNKATDRYKLRGLVTCPIKPLAVQNNQQQQEKSSPIKQNSSGEEEYQQFLHKHEPLIKLEEVASVTHPMNDLLDVDLIKKEVEEMDES